MAGNASLRRADRVQEDEFYTVLSYIEKELRHYKAFFKGKVVLCNCDDPYESNFFKYFAMNFNSLGLKKLITTCYVTSPVIGKEFEYFVDNGGQLSFVEMSNTMPFTEEAEKHPYKVEITEVKDETGDGRIGLADVEYLMRNKKNVMTLLDGDGDFRSPECVELLKEADVIVTNPPFSLFREYVAQLIELGKHFLIIGSQNAITYKEIFPLLKENKMWLGYNSGDMVFTVPDYYEPRKTRYWEENGVKYRSMGNICWYTNIDIPKRHEELLLYRTYNNDEYPHYDNYDAINVDRVANIPIDYYGIMGVPITFLDKHNPEQFEIIDGIGRYSVLNNEETKRAGKYLSMIDGKAKFFRIVIRRKQVQPDED